MSGSVSKAQVIVVMVAAVVCVAVGEALLSAGMKQVGRGGHTGLRFIFAAATNLHVVGGTALMAVFYGLYALALSWADLSFVLPITAFSYLLGAILAHSYLGETVTLTRWIGASIITLGVVVVGRGG